LMSNDSTVIFIRKHRYYVNSVLSVLSIVLDLAR
jgi:hypothetical protein